MFTKTLALIGTMFLFSIAVAQVAPPKRGKLPPTEDLDARYKALSCAMVTISWEETTVPSVWFGTGIPWPITTQHFGSGFYASEDGKIVTAAHVVANKSWSDPGTGMVIILAPPEEWIVENSNHESFHVPQAGLMKTSDAWGADIAVLDTHRVPPCWLRTGDATAVLPGQHILTLGFPQLAFRSLSVYSGIVVARLKLDLLMGATIQGGPVKAQNDFLRVQMPISPGLSGAAVVDDNNEAIAVVSLAGSSSQLLDFLIAVADMQDLLASQPGAQRNLDWPWAVGELAKRWRESASPGYGDSVPLSYLTKRTLSPTHHGVVKFVHPQQSDHPN